MVRLCFALFLFCKREDRIDVPRRLVYDLEGEVADEKFHECALGNDILSADLNSEYPLLLNIRKHRAFGVTHNVGCLICSERVGKVPQPLINAVAECISAFVSRLDIAIRGSRGIQQMTDRSGGCPTYHGG